MSNTTAHILVADDSPMMRKIAIEILQKFGYKVGVVEDGLQAVAYFKQHHPDLMLMDADMPFLDGVSACAQIKSLPEAKYLPILVVTAFVVREWVDKAYAAGATDYITKPVNWDVLRHRIQYILQARRAEEALFDEKEKAQITLASIGDGVITTNALGLVEYLNPVAARLTGWTTEQAYGKDLNEVFNLIYESSQQKANFPIELCIKNKKIIELDYSSQDIVLQNSHTKQHFAVENTAAPIYDRHGAMVGVVLVFHDMTENRRMTQKLSYQAKHDALTGLFNRHEFNHRLKNILQNSHNSHKIAKNALLYMDLDQFKIINDTCGHDAGDQLLKDVAMLLQTVVDQSSGYARASLARLGGDEFGLLLEQCNLTQALCIGQKLCDEIQNFCFFWHDERHNKQVKKIFKIGISIGLLPINTPLSEQQAHQKSILAMADAACYAAKNAGRNNVHVYQDSDLAEEIAWVAVINQNLANNSGFHLFYQAIIPVQSTTKNKFYEILLRMEDQHGKLARPGAFLSTAARYNLMPTLDLYVITKTLAWLEVEQENLLHLQLISLNISAYSLMDKDFLPQLINLLDNSKLAMDKLCFELSETSVINNLSGARNFIITMKKLHCKIAIDDFGSGISAFNMLRKLPIDFIKLDGKLVRTIAQDKLNYAIVKSINELAHLLNIATVAEYVENEAIFQHLQILQVDYAQGFWVAKPQPLT